MKQFILVFDDRPDDGPVLIGPFGSREAAFQHASNVSEVYPEFTFAYEARPLTSPVQDRPGARSKRTGSTVEIP